MPSNWNNYNILTKCILTEILSLAKNDIDRDISLGENDIDRDISLGENIIDRDISLPKDDIDREGNSRTRAKLNIFSLTKPPSASPEIPSL